MNNINYINSIPFKSNKHFLFANKISTIIDTYIFYSNSDTIELTNLISNSVKRSITDCITHYDHVDTFKLLCSQYVLDIDIKKFPVLYKFINDIRQQTFAHNFMFMNEIPLAYYSEINYKANGNCMMSNELFDTIESCKDDISDRLFYITNKKVVKPHLIIKIFLNMLRYSFGSLSDDNIITQSNYTYLLRNDCAHTLTFASMACRAYIKQHKLGITEVYELYYDVVNYIGYLSKLLPPEYTMFENDDYYNIAIEQLKPSLGCVTINDSIDNITNFVSNTDYSYSEINDNCHKNIKYNKDISIPDNIDKYVTNVNKKVYKSNINIVGREDEVEQCILILNKLDRHNVMLLGDAGVGKTSVVDALAYKLLTNDVPINLQNKIILSVSQTALLSGAKYRGDFEDRLNNLLEFAKDNGDVILYFDEIHTGSYVGNTEGAMSVFDILKPYLSENYSRIIASTTNTEYSQSIANDKAIVRRFQNITIEEPNKDMVELMFKSNVERYKEHYSISISEDIFNYLYNKCVQFINFSKFPDKLFNVLDNCGSYCNLHNVDNLNNEVIDTVISNISNVPVTNVKSSLSTKLNNFNNVISTEIIGQEKAITEIIKTLKVNSVGINESNRPLCSFMFIGSTGVGKTQIAKTLAKEWFGSENKLIRLDMTECSNSSDTSKILGSVPGYVGYESKNNFVEKVKNNPYSVVLFDEIEKAHSDVINLLLQVLDDGFITDSSGENIDFTHTIIIMTSNCGAADVKLIKTTGFNKDSSSDIESNYMKSLYNKFNPEFINRIDNIIVFNSMNKDIYVDISKKFINELSNRLINMNYTISFDNSIIDYIANQKYESDMGARPIKRFIKNNIESFIAENIIDGNINTNEEYVIKYDNEIKLISKILT